MAAWVANPKLRRRTTERTRREAHGVGIDTVDPAAPVRGRAEALSQATPPRKGQGGRGRRRKGILVEIASQEDRDLPEGGRGLEGRQEEGGAIGRRGSRPAGRGVKDESVKGAIPEELKVSGTRAEALGESERAQPGGNPTDGGTNVARIAVPKDLG